MKFAFLTAGAAVALLATTPALAVTPASSTSVTITGSVPAQCGVGNQSGGGTRGGPASVPLGVLTGPTGQLSVADQDIFFDNVWCNSGNTITMTVTSLKTANPVSDPSSFTNHLEMVVGTDTNAQLVHTYFGVDSVQTNADGTDGVATKSLAGAFETGTGKYSAASLHIQLPTGTAGNDRPVAGDYSGTVTFTASPS